jgi:hypothetical protein
MGSEEAHCSEKYAAVAAGGEKRNHAMRSTEDQTRFAQE